MSLASLKSHYITAMANWSICLDELVLLREYYRQAEAQIAALRGPHSNQYLAAKEAYMKGVDTDELDKEITELEKEADELWPDPDA